jgi:hypothetical protein
VAGGYRERLDEHEQVFDAATMGLQERSEPDLELLGARVQPTVLARQQEHLPVLPGLEALLPGAGLRRGTTIGVAADAGSSGATSLALALAVAASSAGSWMAAVGLRSLGLVAADELGIALERLVLVAAPERDAWGSVVAALVDGFDILVVAPGRNGVKQADARRLVARARERGTVLIALGAGWPLAPDVTLRVGSAHWVGIDDGHGHLQARRVVITRGGRGEAGRPLTVELWLPDEDGLVTPVERSAEQQPAPAADHPAVRAAARRRLRAVS